MKTQMEKAFLAAGLELPNFEQEKSCDEKIIGKKGSMPLEVSPKAQDVQKKSVKNKKQGASESRVKESNPNRNKKSSQSKNENSSNTHLSPWRKDYRSWSDPSSAKKSKKAALPSIGMIYEGLTLQSKTTDKIINNNSDGEYCLTVGSDAKLIWKDDLNHQTVNLLHHSEQGISTQISQDSSEQTELIIGFDFGTSTVKAVVHDKAQEQSYAVPFRDVIGIQGYLLPCRVFYNDHGYSLEYRESTDCLNDLKIGLLENADSKTHQIDTIAFIALAIRQIRAWLFESHRGIYANYNLLWSIAIGIPIANHKDTSKRDLFKQVMQAAWLVANHDETYPNREIIEDALYKARAILNRNIEPTELDDIGIDVVPEIAAQIHGFVSSDGYDPKGKNIYLMVDVGAGTVDASVFKVDRKSGKDNFVIFSATVEFYGTMKLHQYRAKWWCDALRGNVRESCDSAVLKQLQHETDDLLKITETETLFPDYFQNYFSGISFESTNSSWKTPDKVYRGKINTQIGQDTYVDLEKKKLLRPIDLIDMPILLCGGGSKMAIYQQILKFMEKQEGSSWFRTKKMSLTKPKKLDVSGVIADDYHRLSVAYGLSRINLGKIIDEIPPILSMNEVVPYSDFRDNYIEK